MIHTIINQNRSLIALCERYPVLSFDIFDTLIVRKCIKPVNVFDMVETQYNTQHECALNFTQHRIIAEKKAREYIAKEEITIDDIYDNLRKVYLNDICDELKRLEESFETELCVARHEVVDVYNNFVKKKPVFITSDMYLHKETILRILNRNNILSPKKLYLSCEYGHTKRTGHLFNDLLIDNGLKAYDVLHIGDNFKSDFLRPRLLGMKSYWMERSRS